MCVTVQPEYSAEALRSLVAVVVEAQCVEKATLPAGNLSDYDKQSHLDNLCLTILHEQVKNIILKF